MYDFDRVSCFNNALKPTWHVIKWYTSLCHSKQLGNKEKAKTKKNNQTKKIDGKIFPYGRGMEYILRVFFSCDDSCSFRSRLKCLSLSWYIQMHLWRNWSRPKCPLGMQELNKKMTVIVISFQLLFFTAFAGKLENNHPVDRMTHSTLY